MTDGSVAQGLPRDGRGGLDLGDGGGPGGPSHEVEEERVRSGEPRLRQEDLRGPLLGVCEGDVEAHAAGARGPDLQVNLGARAMHAVPEDLQFPWVGMQLFDKVVDHSVGVAFTYP